MLTKVGRYSVCCIGILVLLMLLAGCTGEDSQAILDLVPLEMQLLAEYGGSNIVVTLQDGDTLGFTVVADAAGSLSSEQWAEQAREIAEFACDHYRSIGSIDQVWVAFEIRQDGSVVDTTGSITYSFARDELERGGR
jgi:hypothetical protein